MDVSAIGTPQNLFLAGVFVGVWWSNYSRRDQGRRIGEVEQTLRELLALWEKTRKGDG